MKKKFLVTAVAATMALSAMGALVACGDDETDAVNNADVAKQAVGIVHSMYADRAQETATDYEVIGQAKVGDEYYTVNWSVSSDVADYGNYVVVGSMDESTKMVTVSITKAEVEVAYTLTASVTVGDATESVDFSRKIPAQARGHAGTAEDPYEVANIKEIGATLASGSKYQENGEPKQIWVTGYVVDPGTAHSSGTRINHAYIVDEYSADKDKNSADALDVYTLSYDSSVFTGQYPLAHGDKITITGFIENFNGTIEISYNGSVSVTCVSLTPAADTRTDEQKVQAAVNAVALTATKFTATGDVTLPSSSVRGVSLNWAEKADSEYVSISGSTLTVSSLPTTETEIVLTVTASIDGSEATASKDVTIKVAPAVDLGLEHAGTAADPHTLADVNKIFATLAEGTSYQVNGVDKEVYVKGYVTVGGEAGTYRLNNVYIADVAGTAQAESVLVYGIDWDAEKLPEGTTLSVGDLVVIKGYLKDYRGTKEIAQTGSGASAVYPSIVELTPAVDERTDAQKVAAVKEALTLENSYATAGDVNLPKSTVRGVTVTWASDNTERIAIAEDNSKMTIAEIPEGSSVVVHVTATITSGTGEAAVTDTKVFDITLSKDLVLEGEGTQANPYTAADAKKILDTLARGAYYTEENSTVAKEVYITGYVTVAGTKGSYGYNNVYVGATATTAKNDSVLVYSINWDDTYLTNGSKLRVGDQVVVRGYLKDYNGTKEVADNGNTEATNGGTRKYPVLVARTEVVRTDEEKITEALGDVSETLANITETGEVTLPVSTDDSVTFTWTIVSGTAATLSEDGKKLVVSALPSADAEMTLKVTAACGTATPAEKSVTVVVKAGFTIPEGATTASQTIEQYKTDNNWANGTKYSTLNADSNITVTLTGGSNTGKYYTSGNEWRIYQNENPTITVAAATGYKIVAVKVTYNINNTGVLTNSDKTKNYASGEMIAVDAASVVFAVGNTGTATNGQVKITKIEVIYVAVSTDGGDQSESQTPAPEALLPDEQ